MIETISKSKDFFQVDKYGKYIEDSDYTIRINFKVEYDELPPKMKDFLQLLKKENVTDVWITFAKSGGGLTSAKVVTTVIELEYVNKITFHDYYLTHNSHMNIPKKLFYDAIFDFSEANRW